MTAAQLPLLLPHLCLRVVLLLLLLLNVGAVLQRVRHTCLCSVRCGAPSYTVYLDRHFAKTPTMEWVSHSNSKCNYL